jgi:putative peptidoglycan lipid II flippase
LTPYLLLICLTALCGAVLQALRRFAWPAAVPALLNVWWLASVGAIAAIVSDPETRIRLVAAALVVGGALQLALPAMVLSRSGWGPCREYESAREPARAVFRAMLPTVIATAIAQFNTVLDTFLAWLLASPGVSLETGRPWVESGTAAALYFAQRLYQFPLGLIGVAAGTVLYPTLAAHASSKNFAALRDDLTHGLCVALSVAIPASGGLVALAGPITAALFQHGRFTEDDALLTSRITAIYGSAAWAAIALLLVQRGFFAVGDRVTPLKTGLTAVVVNIVLTLGGVWFAGGIGLAAATALTAVFHLSISLFLLRSHVVSLDAPVIRQCVGKTVVASGVMMSACLAAQLLIAGRAGRLPGLAVPLGAGVAAFFGTARLLGLKEPWELIGRRAGSASGPPDEGPTPHAPMDAEFEE